HRAEIARNRKRDHVKPPVFEYLHVVPEQCHRMQRFPLIQGKCFFELSKCPHHEEQSHSSHAQENGAPPKCVLKDPPKHRRHRGGNCEKQTHVRHHTLRLRPGEYISNHGAPNHHTR